MEGEERLILYSWYTDNKVMSHLFYNWEGEDCLGDTVACSHELENINHSNRNRTG